MEHIPGLSEDQAWEYCIREYESSNFVVKFLLDNFFAAIDSIACNWQRTDTALEVGCGAGRSSIRLHKMLQIKSFEASENDPRYVARLLKEGLPFKISQESVYSLDRDSNSVDRVIMLEVLEHLENPELALKELTRVARKSVLISVPHEPLWCALNMVRGKYLQDFGNTPGHINHWGRESLRRLLSQYGTVKLIKMPIPWLVVELEKSS